MNFRSSFIALPFVSALCVACYPIQDDYNYRGNRPPKPPRNQPIDPQQQPYSAYDYRPVDPPAQTMEMPNPPSRMSENSAAESSPPQPQRSSSYSEPKRNTYSDSSWGSRSSVPTAQKAPGKPGYVLSPNTGKLLYVRGIPSGTEIPDQTTSEKKSIRVP